MKHQFWNLSKVLACKQLTTSVHNIIYEFNKQRWGSLTIVFHRIIWYKESGANYVALRTPFSHCKYLALWKDKLFYEVCWVQRIKAQSVKAHSIKAHSASRHTVCAKEVRSFEISRVDLWLVTPNTLFHCENVDWVHYNSKNIIYF